MHTDLGTWQMVIDGERELAIRRAERLGPLVPRDMHVHVTGDGRGRTVTRRLFSVRGPFRPVLRLIGLT